MTEILFIKLNPIAKEPVRSSENVKGFDLHCTENCFVKANDRSVIGTGLSFILPFNTFGLITAKTDFSYQGIDVSCVVIDSDFKGEVKVLLINNTESDFEIKTGQTIAKIVFGYFFTGKIRASNQLNRKSFLIDDDSIVVVRKDFNTRFPQRFKRENLSFDFLADDAFLIAPKSNKTINTGLRFIFSSKVYGLIFGFPDLALQGIDCVEGVMDSDGNNDEIKITIHNKTNQPIYFARGERIAKAIFVKNAIEVSASAHQSETLSKPCPQQLQ